MKKAIATWAVAAWVLWAIGCNNADTKTPSLPAAREVPAGPFTYDAYETLLETHVNESGSVDYAALQANRSPLDGFLHAMGALDPEEYAAWSKEGKLAFWINAYNAITLQYILDHYPIKKGSLVARMRFPENSIRQIARVWDKRTTQVMGIERTLNAIEHEILRVEFDDPRVHMAIVCASIGCPPLRNEAFTADKLDAQLDDQSRDFLSNTAKFRIDLKKKKVFLSPIFDWFGEDFVATYGAGDSAKASVQKRNAVLNFIARHVDEWDRASVTQETYSIDYLDYDWTLNDQP